MLTIIKYNCLTLVTDQFVLNQELDVQTWRPTEEYITVELKLEKPVRGKSENIVLKSTAKLDDSLCKSLHSDITTT